MMKGLAHTSIVAAMIGSLACATGCAVDDSGSSAATDEQEAPGSELVAAAAYDCPSGDVCFYDATDGTGNRCNWSVSDPDWTSGAAKCGWATSSNVKSIFNHAPWDVTYFLQTNYTNKVGSTKSGKRGNLTGTYQLRSHGFNCSLFNRLWGCQ